MPPKPNFNLKGKLQVYESQKSRVIEPKSPIASMAQSVKFGAEHMIRAKHGPLKRQSLDNTVLIAEGEGDLSIWCELLVKMHIFVLLTKIPVHISVFARPLRKYRTTSVDPCYHIKVDGQT